MTEPIHSTQKKLFQTSAAYIAASLTIWGALDLAIDAFSLSNSLLRAAMLAAAIGFLPALTFTWIFGRRHQQDDEVGAQWKGLAVGATSAALCFVVLFATTNPPQDALSIAASPPFSDRAAIAVMPFENLTDDGANEHFADGVVDGIVTQLQGWGEFPVILNTTIPNRTIIAIINIVDFFPCFIKS